ncbi:MAG: putative large multi-functional protein [Fibrobacteres bacterium]|nr:putative large multi-functional protein [Fibrobacterota bacterium]
MKKILLLTASLLSGLGMAPGQVATDVPCNEKDLSPVKGPSPYGPRKVAPPDHDLPADPRPEPVHKGVSLEIWHKAGDNFQPGGMALLPNGDMLELDYNGKLYLVTGLDSAGKVARRALPGPQFTEPLGLLVRNNREVYVSTATSIYAFDFDGTTLTLTRELLAIPKRAGWYGWNADMETDAGHLYASLGVRGSVGRYDFAAGTWEMDYATAMRNSHGMGKDDSGRIWFSDNQGNYRPATPIFLLKAGKDYGVPTQNWTSGSAAWQGTLGPEPSLEAYRSDMIWIPYDKMSHSATDIHFMKSGPFKGQALVGDNRTGHLNRLIPEKVDGQMQGAAIRMTGGLEAGNYRMTEDAKGNLYLGGLGNPGNTYWIWCNKQSGFQRLRFKPDFLGNPAYNDVRTVSLVKDGMVIEFTSDIPDAFLSPANYRAYTFSYIKSVSPYYGGPKSDSVGARILGISKRSNREIVLTLEGLLKESVLGLEFGAKLTGEYNLQSYEMFYTMNRLSTRVPTDIARPQGRVPATAIRLDLHGRFLFVRGAGGNALDASSAAIFDIGGNRVPGVDLGALGGSGKVDVSALRRGLYVLRSGHGSSGLTKAFVIP